MEHSQSSNEIPRRRSDGRQQAQAQPQAQQQVSQVSQGQGSIIPGTDGLDKNTLLVVGSLGMALGLGLFLYREVRNLKTLFKEQNIKNTNPIPKEITDRIEMNSGSVKILEQKLDQLIFAIKNSQQTEKSKINKNGQIMQKKSQTPQVAQEQIPLLDQEQIPLADQEQTQDDDSQKLECHGDEGICFPKNDLVIG